MSLALDASAAVALHFADERGPFVGMESRLADGEEALTAPNSFQEVMEALRRALRERRTTSEDVQAWLAVLDSYNIVPPQHHARVRLELGPPTIASTCLASLTSSSICQSNMPTRMKSAPLVKA